MIVVSDTSPITALLTIGAADVLPQLFGEVVIPAAVRDELLRSHSYLPQYVQVKLVRNQGRVREYTQTVHLGEAEAIELARELQADHLLMDERKARALAQRERIPVIGLLGVVLLAKRRQLIPSARELLNRLESESGMYLAAELKATALETVGE
jgi:predicted nucleic acid-binding protein